MRCQVKLFVAGKVFTEDVHARNYDEARQVAVARNPNARVIGVNAKFSYMLQVRYLPSKYMLSITRKQEELLLLEILMLELLVLMLFFNGKKS